MTERDNCIHLVKDQVKEALLTKVAVISNPLYKKVLKDIIIQGMIKLLEDEVILRVREEDAPHVESILSQCESEFHAFMMKETDREYNTKLRVDDIRFLTKEDGGAFGGVILASKDRRIICINTMLSRLNQCFEEMLPEIRRTLFPGK